MNPILLSYEPYVFLNKKYLNTSTECGCMYCFNRFDPSTVNEFCRDKDAETNESVLETALCPLCGIDAVVPNKLINFTDEMLFQWHMSAWGADSAARRLQEKN